MRLMVARPNRVGVLLRSIPERRWRQEPLGQVEADAPTEMCRR